MSRARKKMYMETTSIDSSRSAAEICAELVKAGANQIASTYKDGRIVGLRWSMRIGGDDRLFDMPVRVEPVFRIINGRRSFPTSYQAVDRAQADRVAWRQLLRWVQAQMAMIDTGMVETAEVFSPYMVGAQGKTLWEMISDGDMLKLLPAPETTQ